MKKIEKYTDLLDSISKYENTIKLHPNFLFRGQSDESWALEPSFTRIVNTHKLTRDKAIQLERECINKFSISAKNILPLKNTISLLTHDGSIDFMGWMTIMQHFSAPTRNLDWSSSPWVALYFACSDLTEKDAVLWIADFRKVTDFYEKDIKDNHFSDLMINSSSPEALVFTMSHNSNERIEAQQSRFSVSLNPLSDHKELIEAAGGLKKIIISHDLKSEILKELNKMNITANTLFPGIDGLGKSIIEYCTLWDEKSFIK